MQHKHCACAEIRLIDDAAAPTATRFIQFVMQFSEKKARKKQIAKAMLGNCRMLEFH